MELFKADPATNLLPYDGIVNYYGAVMNSHEAEARYRQLHAEIDWRHDEAVVFGRRITTRRMVAWYGEEAYSYTYSNTTKQALPFVQSLLGLRQLVSLHTGEHFNSCLLNLYHDGSEGMAWHSDDEKELGRDTTIASLSLGAARKFSFRHKKTRETLSLTLESGSLLVMRGSTQSHWLHSLPKSARVTLPRINLTFRSIRHQVS
ncbi:alpha-ketoglutarate-dependent dioxygenase AlkB [Pedobacter yulinensis]|uniref:Alpha-ketoglutarate-dependent dioxygenase AlkB n=1 Tax=Pedobacter yulinensis TaxID=2126353 RepID=A0A2T3HQT0_9SPHI|nr:alpha-ketoglutarate-dependent dioxygenase AlkB [Pedobacter yulinensis]PST84789.1 alpha-ketoglutarate-dependent dioxygenase AlkB [Pedobacter yulinensis]